jgi:hypothetical protein
VGEAGNNRPILSAEHDDVRVAYQVKLVARRQQHFAVVTHTLAPTVLSISTHQRSLIGEARHLPGGVSLWSLE